MADEEFVKSARISPDKAKQLDDLNISFKDLVEEAIEGKSKEQKTDKKKILVNKLMTNGVYTIIGLCFLSVLNFQSSIFSIALVGGIGGLFTVIGAVQLYLTIREVREFKKNARK